MKYLKPNFDHEWMEALRYREFEKMGKEGWLKVADENYDITNFEKIKDVLNNVDLDYDSLEDDKKKRFENSFKNGEIEIPVAVKFSENDYDLLGGNTRLAGLVSKGINPKLWVIDLSQKEEMTEKWSQKYKNSIDCNNPKGFSQRAHCQGKKKTNESEELEGGLADNKSLIQIAKKHDAKGYYHIKDMMKALKRQLEMGVKIEMEHTDSLEKAKEIAMDHLWEDPSYYTKLKKVEAKETDTSSSGAYSAPLFGKTDVIKRKISHIPNMDLNEEEEVGESTMSSSAGAFDVPAFGKTTKGGRKNPLKIDGPGSEYKGRAVKDKNFPKWGGPDSVFVKVKEKCKKFPYCNQGNTGAIEFIKENKELQDAIEFASKKYGISHQQVENIVLNEIKDIFI